MMDRNNAADAAALDFAKAAVRSASPHRVAAPSPNGAVLPGAGAGKPSSASASIDQLCINTIRTLSMMPCNRPIPVTRARRWPLRR